MTRAGEENTLKMSQRCAQPIWNNLYPTYGLNKLKFEAKRPTFRSFFRSHFFPPPQFVLKRKS
jgi:hypothetical protein